MKEIGGYLELELRKGMEYYTGEGVLPVDTGRTAIYCALADCKAKKVYLPTYLCTSMLQVPEFMGMEYEFYSLDEHFMPPADLKVSEEEAFLYINYFGTGSTEIIWEICQRYQNVLIDNTQAFFSKPIFDEKEMMGDIILSLRINEVGEGILEDNAGSAGTKPRNIYYLYSARKFFGVSDGAYVIKNGSWAMELPRDVSYPHAGHLLRRIEEGAHAAYGANMKNEDRFDEFSPKSMSLLSQKILQGVDYDSVKRQRERNFALLHEELTSCNELSLDHEFIAPMVYPLLVRVSGLREFLVKNKIYVPHWWKDVLARVPEGSFEWTLSTYMVPLPIDQRYGDEEMRYMAELVKGFIQREK